MALGTTALGPGPCPDCLGPTVEKDGIHGKFYGCTFYPACRGSRNFMNAEPGMVAIVNKIEARLAKLEGRTHWSNSWAYWWSFLHMVYSTITLMWVTLTVCCLYCWAASTSSAEWAQQNPSYISLPVAVPGAFFCGVSAFFTFMHTMNAATKSSDYNTEYQKWLRNK